MATHSSPPSVRNQQSTFVDPKTSLFSLLLIPIAPLPIFLMGGNKRQKSSSSSSSSSTTTTTFTTTTAGV
ncbi:hypothetical protein HPP92_007507 [Vanilla planifolia]|uniref:Uncharacterized protein n=1 Tax=Vanilla planifolia TaxID=51239 RepID=A0A835V7S6_VANPL|nr:hypothetical protein HPP92_007507 [Vanilla planifolia]